MSNRDSLGFGDLLPQDVINIFAQDKHSKRGRKKRTRSLGRALGLFRRKKKKNLGTNGQNHGLGPALDLALDGHRTLHQGGQKSGNSHAQPNLNDDKTPAPPQLQENVFIEGSRSKYVEDLHTEAQEGLKMIQQEESNTGMEYQDNESMVSTATAQTNGESVGFVTDSTIADTSSVVSMRSSVSTRSSRHGLTRQGSTFRPLESGKKSEKTKTRRKHRKTAAGVPRHVQRELGMDREGWRLPPRLDERPDLDDESDFSPTSDGLQRKAESPKDSSAGLQTSNVVHPLSKDRVEQLNATHAGHRDNLALLHHLDPLRWKSGSAVVQQGLSSRVMTMSPQAAYLSKIIPNAVLPPSIEVVEISRSSRRSSLRTISKSSIVSSPSPSRASSRASSNITSASRYNANPYMSDSSRWSDSASSETLVSNSSTISSSSTPKQKPQSGDNSAKANKVDVNSSKDSSKVIIKGDQVRKEGQFVRSLSVMKSKRAPPPPNRSHSLHGKKRRSRDLVEVFATEQSPPSPKKDHENVQPGSSVVLSRTLDSTGYHADISSPDDSTGSVSFPLRSPLQAEEPKKDAEKLLNERSCDEQESPQDKKLNKPNSPSSGYSSQDGTSPHFIKWSLKQKGLFAKIPQFFSSRSTSAGLAPALAPQPGDKYGNAAGESKPDVSPSVQTLRQLFNIPPPPKIHAPPPPPPEVWSQNVRSIELLLGPPAPGSSYTVLKKNPKDRRQQRQSPPSSTATERKHQSPTAESEHGSVHVVDAKTESDCTYGKVKKERITQNGTSKEHGKDEKVRLSEMLNGILVKAVDKQGATRAEGQNVKAAEVNINTLPTISSVRISPPSSSEPVDHQVQSTVRDTTTVTSSVGITSPESSWPPPPPPLSQVSASRRDEMELPLPPPPMFVEGELVLSPKVKEQVEVGPLKFLSSQDVENPSLGIPPPPPYSAPPPPTTMKEAPPPPPPPPPVTHKEPSTSVIQEVPPPVSVPSPEKQAPPPGNAVEVSILSSRAVAALPSKDFIPPHHHQEASQPIGQVAPVENFGPPQSIPPPPPQLQPLKQEIDPPQKKISSEPKTEDLSVNVLTPPHGVPPPVAPVIQTSHITLVTDDGVPPSPPFEFRNTPSLKEAEQPPPPTSIPLPPPLPVQVPASITHPSSPPSTKNQTQEKTSAPEAHKELIPVVTASLLQKVKLRSVNSSPEPSEVHEQVSASDVTPPLLEVVTLRSINSSPEHAKGVKEEATSDGPTAVLQTVKLRSINNSPEPPETSEGVKEETLPNGPSSVINNSPETAKGVKEESTATGTHPALQVVKLQPANSSAEASEAVKGADSVLSIESSPVSLQSIKPETFTTQEKPEPDVTVDQPQPDKQVPMSSSNEAPQKPIRKSLILVSPPPTSPPDTDSSEASRPKSVVVPPAASPTAASPLKKSPTTTSSVSMNLQEAIRLRTAARSKEGPASRLTLPSQLSPPGFLRSPTNTASFIFSKSNTRVGIEVKQKQENKETVQKKLENSSVAKVTSEAESKLGGKVPPPVAKKPKTKSKEEEAGEAVEQTAGQEAQRDGTEDGPEEVNGTAGTVQGETST
ncbi:NHS-like protein 3 isoform X1 [Nothobranchius furzeri]|uniref:KIAA1522 n=5 Tax=Nothobranchius TaxID=28779 RepID=A0A9D2XHT9_NOTFU|nr:hypothetical protein G4P62_015723 [Nothobranchius furzeri]